MNSTFIKCADCDAENAYWASINRGVLICDQCNSIHRQLGRHVSQTKHLSKSLWRPTQLLMVQYLAIADVNRFWEHVLLEPCINKKESDCLKHNIHPGKKPHPNSQIHTSKAEFIREKYLFHGFFKRPQFVQLNDLNKQLHASVRTSMLETSLYLLALGANPNSIHPEKGTSPMHVACTFEQVGQLELLIAYGGDVCIRSANGISPLEIALEKSFNFNADTILDIDDSSAIKASCREMFGPWSPLLDCIISAFYELTDGLSYYLCRHVPDHKAAFLNICTKDKSQSSRIQQKSSIFGPGHFIISSSGTQHSGESKNQNDSDCCLDSRSPIKTLDNSSFEDLCIDVYDEAERRITNSILDSVEDDTSDCIANGIGSKEFEQNCRPHSVATTSAKHSLILFFLPPNIAYSSVRNQARQKLGRLSTTDFRTLVVDVLTEAAKRITPIVENASDMPIKLTVPKSAHRLTSDLTAHQPIPIKERVNEKTFSTFPNDSSKNVNTQTPNPKTSACSVSLQNEDQNYVDPVYDLVACERESRGPCIQLPVSPPKQVSIVLNKQLTGLDANETSPSDNKSHNSSSVNFSSSPIYVQTVNTDLNNAEGLSPMTISPCSIGSTPGQIPGSRLLHLPAVGRHQSTQVSGRLSDRLTSQQSPELLVPRVVTRTVEVQANSPCCLDSQHEIQELKEISYALREEKNQLDFENTQWKRDKERMEIRVQKLEQFCKQVQEENIALRAAFSAGMVMSHNSREGSPAVISNGKLLSSSLPIQSHDNSSHTLSDANNTTVDDDEDEEYSYNNDDTTTVSSKMDQSNYAVGTRCIDSGILLRQGVSLWGASGSQNQNDDVRMSQPKKDFAKQNVSFSTSVNNGSSTDPKTPSPCALILNERCPNSIQRCPPRTYINVPLDISKQTNKPNAVSKSGIVEKKISVNSKVCLPDVSQSSVMPSRILSSSTKHCDNDVDMGDYTAPNETGSPSPAPIPLIDSNGRSFQQNPDSKSAFASKHNGAIILPKSGMKMQDTSEYCTPFEVPRISTSPVTAIVASEGPSALHIVSKPKSPPYDQIVRSVECIIIRIRGLLEAASNRFANELIRSAQLIQVAVHDLVSIFPPIETCETDVKTALTTLMTNSKNLRQYCDRASLNGGNKASILTMGCAVEPNPLISFAHEIASAAKMILNFYQTNDNC